MTLKEGSWKYGNGQGRKDCEPDAFLSEQFEIHSKIFHLPVRDRYMVLSSGVNELPPPSIWKKTMHKEIEENFLYQQYTQLTGFQATNYAVKLYERFLYSKGNIFLKADLEICMTIGASQAAELAIVYLKSIGKSRILLVGMTYPLYVTLGNEYDYEIEESRARGANRDMPTVEELLEDIELFKPDVIVFSYPCNPSGEKYTDDELEEIMGILLHKEDIYCIFDCTSNIVISKDCATFPEPIIMKSKMRKRSIITNSFSKTESVPGLRIGYVVSDYDVIMFMRSKQVGITNPPNIPTIAVWITLLFRCIYLSEKNGQDEKEIKKIIRYYKRIFLSTTILCSQAIRDYVIDLVDNKIFDEYEEYMREMLEQEEIYEINGKYASEKLHPFLEETTKMDGGFNFLVKLKQCRYRDEMEFCNDVLHKTGIAVFTESSFALRRANEENYWLRISLAVSVDVFRKTIDRLCEYLLELDYEIESSIHSWRE